MQPHTQNHAHSRDHRNAAYGSAVALIGLGLLVHYGWALVPSQHQAQAWNACGAFGRLALLCALVWRIRSLLILCVALWWAAEELMVIGCSLAYIVSPWPVAAGDAQCSSLLQFDLGRIGLFLAVLLLTVAVKSVSSGRIK